MLGRRSLRRTADASQTESLSRSPRFRLLRMRNTNGRKTTNVSPPTTRIARYLIYAVTDSVFRNDVFGGVIGKYFVFSAVDTAKSKDVPSGLSGLHRKTPDGGGLRRPCLHYTLTRESGKRMLLRLNEFLTLESNRLSVNPPFETAQLRSCQLVSTLRGPAVPPRPGCGVPPCTTWERSAPEG